MTLQRDSLPAALAAVLLLGALHCTREPTPGDPPMRADLVNLDLEQGETEPDGWFLSTWSRDRGYRIALSDESAFEGRRCVRVEGAEGEVEGLGSFLQWVDASAYRGKRLRFSAAVRADVADDNQARLWLRVDEGSSLMLDPPIVDADWSRYEVVGDVPEDAIGLRFGVFLEGHGRVWLDDASLEIVGDAGPDDIAARPLTDTGLANLVALTRLLGYVRYFHPSDEAAAIDWERFAIDAVEPAERATTRDELIAALQEIFEPIAPTIRVHPKTDRPELPAEVRTPPPGASSETVSWRHYGVETGRESSMYTSVRLGRGDTPDLRHLDDVADPPAAPDAPLRAELGAGVAVTLPLSLYATEAATLPAAAGPIDVAPRAIGWTPSADDRSTRLAAVMLGWNVFQHFGPYLDVVPGDWYAMLEPALRAAAEREGACGFLEVLRGLGTGLHDGHVRVWHECDSASNSLPLAWEWVEDRLVITGVVAEQAPGIAVGDVVLALDGRATEERLAEAERRVSGATPQWIRYRALKLLRTGSAESTTSLKLRDPAGEVREITLGHSASRHRPKAPTAALPETIAALGDGLWYVDLDRLSKEQWSEALPELADAPGVVFDLRGYPAEGAFDVLAHLNDEPVTSPSWLVPVVTRPDRESMRFHESSWTVEPKQPRLRGRIVFLTGGGAISAAETFLAIVEHYHLGEIVGGTTAGTNGDINPFKLPGGYGVSWSGLRVLKQDGSRHQGLGIRPTIPAARTLAGVAAGRDEVLERGVAAALGEH